MSMVRKGSANIFVAAEFRAGRRTARVTCRRTKRDFAKFIKHLVDNLNTHNGTALYETYDAEEAERILKKVEFHYTPKHASWLNVAEIEIGVMDAECTGRRIRG